MMEISVSELNNLENYTVIDIRDEIAFEYGSIEGAINIPERDLMNSLNLLDKSKLIVVMCKSGIISDTVAEELRESGIPQDNIIYIDLDKRGFRNIVTADALEKCIDERGRAEGLKYLFIDEIQNV